MNRFYTTWDGETWGERTASPDDPRNVFQVDRDRILFSEPFRALQSKTQVFQSGAYDFYRTRLTHTIEVARIARSLAEFLNAKSPRLREGFWIDPDLAEAVALAHDLGHPPFGHIGERALHQLMLEAGFDGFEGNAQTLRILTERFYRRQEGWKGMAPSRALLGGVLKYPGLFREAAAEGDAAPHNHFLYNDQAALRDWVLEGVPRQARSIECQLMDWADDAAYSLHDIVDGARAGFLTHKSLSDWLGANDATLSDRQRELVADLREDLLEERAEFRSSLRVGQFIRSCSLEPVDDPGETAASRYRYRLDIDAASLEVCSLHKQLARDLIFRSPSLQQLEFKGARILRDVFHALVEEHQSPRGLRLLPDPWSRHVDQLAVEQRPRAMCDFLASLTDGEVIRLHRRLFGNDFSGLGALW